MIKIIVLETLFEYNFICIIVVTYTKYFCDETNDQACVSPSLRRREYFYERGL